METITLGKREVQVHAQAVPYLERQVRRLAAGDLGSLLGGSTDAETIAGRLAASGSVYQLLALVIPNLPAECPEHEFNGFPTAHSFETDDEDAFDQSLAYTFPQLVTAIKTVVAVNQFDQLKIIERVLEKIGLDPQKLGPMIESMFDEATDRLEAETVSGPSSQSSSNSASTNGASDSTKHSGTDPTPTAPTDSPSPGSSSSQTTTPPATTAS